MRTLNYVNFPCKYFFVKYLKQIIVHACIHLIDKMLYTNLTMVFGDYLTEMQNIRKIRAYLEAIDKDERFLYSQ